MIEKYGFFDSVEGDEREYAENDFAKWGEVMAMDGVRGGENALKVTAYATGLAVRVTPGGAMIRGRYYALEDDGSGERIIDVGRAVNNPRIDRIVLRISYSERKIYIAKLVGDETENPQPPKLMRNENGYMLSLAQVRANVGAERLTEADIVDERADESVCGMYVTSPDTALKKATEAATAAQNAHKAADDAAQAAEDAKAAANNVANTVANMKKVAAGGVHGNLLVFDENGNAHDSGKAANKLGTGATYTLNGTVLTITTL